MIMGNNSNITDRMSMNEKQSNSKLGCLVSIQDILEMDRIKRNKLNFKLIKGVCDEYGGEESDSQDNQIIFNIKTTSFQ
jgi:hypothetical protein